jgi:hypothetical protein
VEAGLERGDLRLGGGRLKLDVLALGERFTDLGEARGGGAQGTQAASTTRI